MTYSMLWIDHVRVNQSQTTRRNRAQCLPLRQLLSPTGPLPLPPYGFKRACTVDECICEYRIWRSASKPSAVFTVFLDARLPARLRHPPTYPLRASVFCGSWHLLHCARRARRHTRHARRHGYRALLRAHRVHRMSAFPTRARLMRRHTRRVCRHASRLSTRALRLPRRVRRLVRRVRLWVRRTHWCAHCVCRCTRCIGRSFPDLDACGPAALGVLLLAAHSMRIHPPDTLPFGNPVYM
jgi:hypothetical protein